MSYSCYISFKQLAGDDVYNFFLDLKKEAVSHIPDIAKQEYMFSPLCRIQEIGKPFQWSEDIKEKTENWAKQAIFHYRYFYNKELQLLGVYSVPDCMQNLFDTTIYFQNSCDQDYEYTTWKGVPYFEMVVEKWSTASEKEVKNWYTEKENRTWDADDWFDLDYFRKTIVYKEIWEQFRESLFDDDAVVHLSLFGGYDYGHMKHFYQCIEDVVKKEMEKEERRK